MQAIGGKDLINEVEIVFLGEPAEKIIVQVIPQAQIHLPALLPHLRRPEDSRLRNHVPFPDCQHPSMALKMTGMLNSDKTSFFIDKAAASHHHVPPAGWVNLLGHTVQSTGQQCVIRV